MALSAGQILGQKLLQNRRRELEAVRKNAPICERFADDRPASAEDSHQRNEQSASAKKPTVFGAILERVKPPNFAAAIPIPEEKREPSPPVNTQKNNKKVIKVYPSLLTAMLANEKGAGGRVWLLAKYLDRAGRGWLDGEFLRDKLTQKDSPLFCFGWRRLRQILAEGEGLFWDRDRFGRIWLYGAGRVARGLDCDKLTGHCVELPIESLTGGIQGVRAGFLAAFHSGRVNDAPIARATIRGIVGRSETSQRRYEDKAGIDVKENYCVSSVSAEAGNMQKAAWEHGAAAFQFWDYRHKRAVIARQLPNSYQQTLATAPTGRKRRVNRKICTDLVTTVGSGGTADRERFRRLYVTNWKHVGKRKIDDQPVFLYSAEAKSGAGLWFGYGIL